MIDNASVIILNKYVGADRRDLYIPTYIDGAFWHEVDKIEQYQSGSKDSATVVVRVPEGAEVYGVREFIDPHAYNMLDADAKRSYWTVEVGKTIVAKCAGGTVLPDGCTYTDIQGSGLRYVTAVEFADNTERGYMLKHYRIGGA